MRHNNNEEERQDRKPDARTRTRTLTGSQFRFEPLSGHVSVGLVPTDNTSLTAGVYQRLFFNIYLFFLDKVR